MAFYQAMNILLNLLLLHGIAVVSSIQCGWDEFECIHTSKCIDSEYMCDGDNDCGDWYDESADSCGFHEIVPVVTTRSTSSSCKETEFDCHDKCIPRGWLCDGEHDCEDGSDEANQNCLKDSSPTESDSGSGRSEELPTPTIIFRRPEFRTPSYPRRQGYTRFFNEDEDFQTSQYTVESTESEDISSEVVNYTYESTAGYEAEFHTTSDSTSMKTVPSTITYSDSSDISESTLDNCETQTDTVSIFSWSNWMEITLTALGFIMLIIIIAIIYRKRRMHVTSFNPKRHEQRHVVSYINTPTAPECQLVLVGSAVNIQPAVLQPVSSSNTYPQQPPPYDTKPTNEVLVQTAVTSSECLV